MKKFVIFTVLVLAYAMTFGQNESKYLVYKETTKSDHSHLIHILAGKDLAVVYNDMKIPNPPLPLLNCNLVSRKPAGYRMLDVVDNEDGIYVCEVSNARFLTLSKKQIKERTTPDSTFMAILNDIIAKTYPDSVIENKPVVMKFTPNIGSEKIGSYDCTIGKMQITESYSCKIWYTKAMNYNWTFIDELWLVPGMVVRAEYSDGLTLNLESVTDSNLAIGNSTESVRKALHLLLGR